MIDMYEIPLDVARDLAKDAHRYRWLREHWAEMTGLDWREPRAEKLDAHIDAARAANTPNG